VSVQAEYQRDLPFHVSIDPGVHCGAIWCQVRRDRQGAPGAIHVFADYFAEAQSAETNARAILQRSESLCGIGLHGARVSMDPAGNQRTAVGPIVRAEFERVGCCGKNGLEMWPTMGAFRPKADTLELIATLLEAADGTVRLTIHPRCRNLIRAFQGYSRARRNNQLMDYPEPVCHPHEDMIDPLAGGLSLEFPSGRTPPLNLKTYHMSSSG
jgi:hypothetical protein